MAHKKLLRHAYQTNTYPSKATPNSVSGNLFNFATSRAEVVLFEDNFFRGRYVGLGLIQLFLLMFFRFTIRILKMLSLCAIGIYSQIEHRIQNSIRWGEDTHVN